MEEKLYKEGTFLIVGFINQSIWNQVIDKYISSNQSKREWYSYFTHEVHGYKIGTAMGISIVHNDLSGYSRLKYYDESRFHDKHKRIQATKIVLQAISLIQTDR